jgi:hypothetical protein
MSIIENTREYRVLVYSRILVHLTDTRGHECVTSASMGSAKLTSTHTREYVLVLYLACILCAFGCHKSIPKNLDKNGAVLKGCQSPEEQGATCPKRRI